MTKPTDAERCLARAAQLRPSPTMGDAIPHYDPSLRELADLGAGPIPPYSERTAAERDRPLSPAIGEHAIKDAARLRERVKELERDCMTLCLRLCLEPSDSHAPETLDVLDRWRPAWEAAAAGFDLNAAAVLAPIPLAQQAAAQREIIKGVCHNVTSNAQPCGNMKLADSRPLVTHYRCDVCGLTEVRGGGA